MSAKAGQAQVLMIALPESMHRPDGLSAEGYDALSKESFDHEQ
jgi:hypothetical protein